VQIEATITERTFAATLVKVLASFVAIDPRKRKNKKKKASLSLSFTTLNLLVSYIQPQGSLVIGNQLFLLFFRFTPITTGANEIRLDSTFRARSNDFIFKLFLLSPFAYAVQTYVRKDNK
jgi:hypothetical protein